MENGSPTHRYLLSILEFYRETGNEKYVLSKLLNTGSLPMCIQALFCSKCLVIFVPVVNCKTELRESDFLIECKLCGLKMCVEVDFDGQKTVDLGFEDLFTVNERNQS